MTARIIVIMGVAGSGKTTVGSALAQKLDYKFYDGDDFHSPENIAKMTEGIPLTDEDRGPWLATLHDLLTTSLEQDTSCVLACSALKSSYREVLLGGLPAVELIYLRGDYEVIKSRMLARREHYMKVQLLNSQFEALEEPAEVLTVEVSHSVDQIVSEICTRLGFTAADEY